ncbi:MAG: HK97 family phage prohead protease [Dermatophilaceae bacterium]|nr:HK97 family phage prohead protease [Dermatophilaceae bacterium]NUR81005.1 HK97 family phage prohead protease [Dermatophilaceae bacterium]
MTDAERRFTSVRVEVRAAAADEKRIGGYAALFNSASQNLGGFREFIAPGAFNRAASRNWPGGGVGVFARYNHDDNMILGNTDSGTLRLFVDDQGLGYDVLVPSARSDVYELVQRGDVRSSSFAFVAEDDEWATDDTGFPVRTLRQVQLIDVAPVNTPAYLDTSVGLRSLAKKFDAPLEEVRQMAQANELTRFFKRTDTQDAPASRSSQAALAAILALDPNASL